MLAFILFALFSKTPVAHLCLFLVGNPLGTLSTGVSYYVGEITDPETGRSTLARIKPRVIIHAVAPAAFDPSSNATYCNKVNINGTKNLLAYASEAPSVIAFVYTSSSSVLATSLFQPMKHGLFSKFHPRLTLMRSRRPWPTHSCLKRMIPKLARAQVSSHVASGPQVYMVKEICK